MNLAQTENPHIISHGFEDGYNPYGFGDFGFGYGSAQTQYKKVQAKLQAFDDAVDLLKNQQYMRVTRTREAFDELLNNSVLNLEAGEAAKLAQL